MTAFLWQHSDNHTCSIFSFQDRRRTLRCIYNPSAEICRSVQLFPNFDSTCLMSEKKSHATAILRFQLLHWTILAVALHSRCRALTSWDHANQSSCLTMITKKTRHKKARSCRSKVPHLCRSQRACFHTFEKLNSPYRVLTGMQHANLKLAAASVQLHKKTSKANPF